MYMHVRPYLAEASSHSNNNNSDDVVVYGSLMSLHSNHPMEAYSPAAPPSLPEAAVVSSCWSNSLLTRWWAADRASG